MHGLVGELPILGVELARLLAHERKRARATACEHAQQQAEHDAEQASPDEQHERAGVVKDAARDGCGEALQRPAFIRVAQRFPPHEQRDRRALGPGRDRAAVCELNV